MRNSEVFATVLLVIGLTSYVEADTSEISTDSSKSMYGAVSSILGSTENTHTYQRNTYDNPSVSPPQGVHRNTPGNYYNGPTSGNFFNGPPPSSNNSPCTTAGCTLPTPVGPCTANGGCPFPQNKNPSHNSEQHSVDNSRLDIENPAVNGAGQLDVRSGPSSINSNVGFPQQPYPQPYSPPQNYYPPNQVNNGFSRYPPPQQMGFAQGYGPPPPQNQYPYGQQWPYPQQPSNVPHAHSPNCGHNSQSYPHQHNSNGYSKHNHSLKINTEYKEDGHHEFTNTGTNGYYNGNGFGSGYGGSYNGAFNRPGF